MKFLPFRAKTLVLLYHRIAKETSDPWSLCVTPEHFAEHLEVLQRYRRIPLRAVDPSSYPRYGAPNVVVTFDDGYSDNATTAAPLLLRYATPATFFIATGYINGTREYWWDELERIIFGSPQLPRSITAFADGQTFSWKCSPEQSLLDVYGLVYNSLRPLAERTRRQLLDQLGSICCAPNEVGAQRLPMTLDSLQRLAGEPLFEIGAHTVMHPLLAALPALEQHAEIQESKAFLERQLDREIDSFSYPYGGTEHYSQATVAAVRECGFRRACTTDAHPVSRRKGPLEIGRLNITDMDGDAFHKFLFS